MSPGATTDEFQPAEESKPARPAERRTPPHPRFKRHPKYHSGDCMIITNDRYRMKFKKADVMHVWHILKDATVVRQLNQFDWTEEGDDHDASVVEMILDISHARPSGKDLTIHRLLLKANNSAPEMQTLVDAILVMARRGFDWKVVENGLRVSGRQPNCPRMCAIILATHLVALDGTGDFGLVHDLINAPMPFFDNARNNFRGADGQSQETPAHLKSVDGNPVWLPGAMPFDYVDLCCAWYVKLAFRVAVAYPNTLKMPALAASKMAEMFSTIHPSILRGRPALHSKPPKAHHPTNAKTMAASPPPVAPITPINPHRDTLKASGHPGWKKGRLSFWDILFLNMEQEVILDTGNDYEFIESNFSDALKNMTDDRNRQTCKEMATVCYIVKVYESVGLRKPSWAAPHSAMWGFRKMVVQDALVLRKADSCPSVQKKKAKIGGINSRKITLRSIVAEAAPGERTKCSACTTRCQPGSNCGAIMPDPDDYDQVGVWDDDYDYEADATLQLHPSIVVPFV